MIDISTAGEKIIQNSSIHIAFLCIVMFGSALLSSFAVRRLAKIAHARKLFDDVNERTVHAGFIPRLGGISFLPAIAFSVCLFGWISGFIFSTDIAWFLNYSELLLLFAAMLLVYGMGAEDDIIGLSYKPKFLGQSLAIVLLLCTGVYIHNLRGFICNCDVMWWIGLPLSFLFLLLIVNSLNLIDGIDGLAGGLSLIALLFYTTIFIYTKTYIYALVCVAASGVLLGFLRFNVWGSADKKNKVFMGDTGSLTLGILLGFMSLRVFNTPGDGYMARMPIVTAIAPLLLPCLDLLHVFTMRLLKGKNPFEADRTHIHHRVLALGYSHRQALYILLLTSIGLTLLNVVASIYMDINLLVILDLLIWVVGNWWLQYKAKYSD